MKLNSLKGIKEMKVRAMVKTITTSKEKERVRIKERMLMTSTISSWVFYFSEHKKNNVIPQS